MKSVEFRNSLILFLLVSSTCLKSGFTDSPKPGTYSKEQHNILEQLGERVKMRDGVQLTVDIFRPATPGRFPVILCHTPYNRQGSGFKKRASWFAKRGYAVVNADVRGRFDSQGTWDPFTSRHKTDGYDLVEWFAKQDWSSGKVGMYGLSYMGWTQWWTANAAPPSLRCIVPEVAPPDAFENAPYQQGVITGWMLDWGNCNFGRTANRVGPGPYGGFSRKRFQDFMQAPYLNTFRKRSNPGAAWQETWLIANKSTHKYWRDISYQGKANYAKVKVPSLAVSGWFDANYPGTPMNYLGMKRHGATAEARAPHMVIGPWTHVFNRQRELLGINFGQQGLIDWNGYVCKWFDYHLKNIQNHVLKDPPVHLFVMGHNRWRSESEWPLPQTVWTKYYFHSHGHANSSQGDGFLNTQVPGNEPADRYTYSPLSPTKSEFQNGHIDGPRDIRASSIGKDVLVYSTPPLKEDLEVVGPITAKLYAATSASDTDWMVRLVDVHPNGHAAFLADGVIRARCRNPKQNGAFQSTFFSNIEPNKTYEYTIKFWRGTGNAFLKGHRLRIEISSSYYPFYLRNLNTGDENIALAKKPVIAHQTLFHNSQFPSHVVLPVIPKK